jgi:DNA-binding response OmpR family regulator
MQEKGRILCVDDDLDTCQLMRIVLESEGYEVAFATSVAEGFSLVKNERCDLILLDGLFDDGTGVELCRRIRAFDPDTPIVFCSGAVRQSDIAEAMCAGAQEYIIKPIVIKELLQTITRLTRAVKDSAGRAGVSNDIKTQTSEGFRISRGLSDRQKKIKTNEMDSRQPRQA